MGGGTKMKIFINFLLTILNLCVIRKNKGEIMGKYFKVKVKENKWAIVKSGGKKK